MITGSGRVGVAKFGVVQVVELWRFPVKSFQGEQLDAAEIGPDGIVGDRAYALFDLDTGFGLTARRVPELLLASARLVRRRPGGHAARRHREHGDDRVSSDWLGRRVALRRAGRSRRAVLREPTRLRT